MENASKALLMAGGVLIGILVLSLAVYLYTSFSNTFAQVNERNETQQIIKFNNQFSKYINRTDLTIYDIITVTGYGKENGVIVKLENVKLNEKTKIELDDLLKKDLDEITNKKELPKYKCLESNVKYDGENGKISTIIFNKIK